jgi:hypothetical protein
LRWGAKGKRGLEVPGLRAHGTIDNLQFVFPEIGRTAERRGECSKQKAVPASPGKCSEQQAAIVAANRTSPGPGECSEPKEAVAATNRANPRLSGGGQNTWPQKIPPGSLRDALERIRVLGRN